MTALPPFGDQEVHKAAIKMTGAGTGLPEGIKVKPLVLDIGETAYFVIEARCAGVEHVEDKDEFITRVHKLHTENMAPISEEIAQQALLAYTREVEQAKADADGQESLFRDDDARFQGRTGVHPVQRTADDEAGDEEAESLAVALADDQASADERAALERERLDETGSPAEVAGAARARVEGNVFTPAFSAQPLAGE